MVQRKGENVSYPRWIVGGPTDTGAASPALLREVAAGLFVGSALSAPHAPKGSAVAQFSRQCPPAADAAITLRVPFADCEAIPSGVLYNAVAFARVHRGERPMLLQCFAGLSRSASVAYAVLRAVDGLDHDAALVRVAHSVDHFDRTVRFPHNVTLGSARAWCDAQEKRR